MKHRPRPEEQDDLLRPRLIDWKVFKREWAGFFPSGNGGPAKDPRLVAGLLYLQHAYRLSD
jgi:IS5 family transposase